MSNFGFTLVGGPNYTGDDPQRWPTLEAALNEWARRRADWTGRFPCWGDGLTLTLNPQPQVEGWESNPEVEVEGRADCIILLGNEDQTLDGWTLEEALVALNREDELFLYLD